MDNLNTSTAPDAPQPLTEWQAETARRLDRLRAEQPDDDSQDWAQCLLAPAPRPTDSEAGMRAWCEATGHEYTPTDSEAATPDAEAIELGALILFAKTGGAFGSPERAVEWWLDPRPNGSGMTPREMEKLRAEARHFLAALRAGSVDRAPSPSKPIGMCICADEWEPDCPVHQPATPTEGA